MGAEVDPRLVGGSVMRTAVSHNTPDGRREAPGSATKPSATDDDEERHEQSALSSQPEGRHYCDGHPLEGLLLMRHPSVVDVEPRSLRDLTDAERATNTDLFFAIQQGALLGGAREDLHDCRHGSFA